MKSKPFALIILATFLTSAFVWVRLQIVSISYDIHELQTKEKEVREMNNSLNLKIHEYRSPYRLEQLAKNHFKMSAPRTDQIIIMSDR